MGQLGKMEHNETLLSAGTAPRVSIPAVMIRYLDWSHVANCRSSAGLAVGATSQGELVYDIDYGSDVL